MSQPPPLNNRLARFFGIGLELATLMFSVRLVVDTGTRIFMPFIPQLALGVGLTLTAFSWLLALRTFTGIISPVVGIMADRYGRRPVMASTLIVRGLSLFGLAFSKGWWSAIPMLLISMTNSCFLPVQKAYISDQVSYERRGRALAMVDASFATAGAVSLPLIGWGIEIWGWQLPLYILGGLTMISALLIAFRLPNSMTRTYSSPPDSNRWKLLFQSNILASVVVSMILIFIFVVFMMFWALWLTDDFGSGPIEIGITATYIGIAEFAGLLLAGLFIDRIGKQRGTLIGLLITITLFAVIPLFQQTLFSIRILLSLTGIAIEFVITAAIPLFAEQAPEARATVFSLVSLGSAFGAGLAPPLTTTLWAWGGVIPIVAASILVLLLAIVLIWRYIHDHPDTAPAVPVF